MKFFLEYYSVAVLLLLAGTAPGARAHEDHAVIRRGPVTVKCQSFEIEGESDDVGQCKEDRCAFPDDCAFNQLGISGDSSGCVGDNCTVSCGTFKAVVANDCEVTCNGDHCWFERVSSSDLESGGRTTTMAARSLAVASTLAVAAALL